MVSPILALTCAFRRWPPRFPIFPIHILLSPCLHGFWFGLTVTSANKLCVQKWIYLLLLHSIESTMQPKLRKHSLCRKNVWKYLLHIPESSVFLLQKFELPQRAILPQYLCCICLSASLSFSKLRSFSLCWRFYEKYSAQNPTLNNLMDKQKLDSV